MKKIVLLFILVIPALSVADPTARDKYGARIIGDPITDLNSLVDQTAAVVEGTVSKVDYEYSEERGAWTAFTFTNLVIHRGQLDNPQTLVIRQAGGWLPNNKMMSLNHFRPLVKNARYIVFLQNTVWNLSPIRDDMAYRIETIDGKDRLIDTDGAPVISIDDRGINTASVQLFESVDNFGNKPARTLEKAAGLSKAEFLQKLLKIRPASDFRGRMHAEPQNKNSMKFDVAPAKVTP